MKVRIHGHDIEIIMTLAEWHEEYQRAARGARSTIDPAVEKKLRSLGLPLTQWTVEGVAYSVRGLFGQKMRMRGRVTP